MSQDALAARVDIPVEIIGKIERGTTNSSYETVEKIASALVLPPLALFGVGEHVVHDGERGAYIRRITKVLAGSSDAQLERIVKMVEAFVGVG